MNNNARRLKFSSLFSSHIDWLTDGDTRDMGTLADRLSRGVYDRAIGIEHRPTHLAELVETLLIYTPILLWPRAGAELDGRQRRCLDAYWERLPDQFIEAYRNRWRAEAGGPVRAPRPDDEHLAGLAALRAAWHDSDWLDFCRWFEQHSPTAQWST